MPDTLENNPTQTPPDDDEQKPLFAEDGPRSVYDTAFDRQRAKAQDEKAQAKSASTEDLKQAEESGAEASGAAAGSSFGYKEEQGRLSQLNPFKPKKSGSFLGRFKKKRFLLMGSIGGGLLVLIAAVLILLGSLKTVHFSTVLRSAGFARFNLYMRRQFAQTTFDAAVLTKDSTGSFELGKRSLIDKLRGVNPEKQLTTLGREGTLKFEFEGESKWGGLQTSNTFKGVEINGERINLDEIAQKFGYKSYNDIPLKDIRARLGVKAEFVNGVRDGLAERLALEGRSFRSGVYDGLRQAAGISLSKWPNKAREYLGLSAEEARAKNLQDTRTEVDQGGPSAESGIDKEEDAAKKQAAENEAAVKEGRPARRLSSEDLLKINSVAKDVSQVVFVTTVACIVHDLDNSFKDAAKPREEQVARFGHNSLTAADQIKQGDVAAEAVGAENATWDGADQAILYKQATGQAITDQDKQQLADVATVTPPGSQFGNIIGAVDQIMQISLGGPFVALLSHVPVIGGIIGGAQKKIINVGCNAVLNQYVQWGIAGTEIGVAILTVGIEKGVSEAIVTGIKESFKLAGTVGLGEALGKLVESAVDSYAGTDFSATTTGARKYNDSAVAYDYLQQTGTRQISYGRPLSPAEANASQTLAMNDLKTEYEQKSFKERYFAASNPFSLFGQLSAYIPSGVAGWATSIRQFGVTILNSLATLTQQLPHIFLSLFAAKQPALAATSSGDYSSYGVDEWGWSNSELDRIRTDVSFTPQNLAAYVEPQYDQLNDKYGPCYSYVLQVDRPAKCTQDFLSSDEALKWRAYMAEVWTADRLTEDLSVGGAQP